MDGWETWAVLGGVAFGAYLVVVWLASVFWTYRDISSRTRDSYMQMTCIALVGIFNLPGLLVYLVLRPKFTLADQYDRRLEAEALLHELNDQPRCHGCRRRIDDAFLACPYCRTALRVACEQCERPLAFGWVVCPFCGAERAQPAAALPSLAPQPRLSIAASPADAADTTAARPARTRRPSTATYTPPAPARAQAAPASPEPGADTAT